MSGRTIHVDPYRMCKICGFQKKHPAFNNRNTCIDCINRRVINVFDFKKPKRVLKCNAHKPVDTFLEDNQDIPRIVYTQEVNSNREHQMRVIKHLECENAKLKRLVYELEIERRSYYSGLDVCGMYLS